MDSRHADPGAAHALDLLAHLYAIHITRISDAHADHPVAISVFGQVLRGVWDAHYPGQWPRYEVADSRPLVSSTTGE